MAAATNLVSIDSPEHFTSVMSADLERITLLNFWAPWAEPCQQMNEVVKELAGKYPKVMFLNVSLSKTGPMSRGEQLLKSLCTFQLLTGRSRVAARRLRVI